MFFKISLFLVCTVFVFCQSAYVDTLTKCKIDDAECGKDLIQSIIKELAKNGMEELGIPPLDPMDLKNMSTSAIDIIDVSILEGTAKGAKDCIVNRFETDIEAEKVFMEMTCDFTIKGRYKMYSNSPLIKSFIGGDSLSGEGNGKIKIEKLKVKVEFNFHIQKRDGELYLKLSADHNKYSVDIKKMQFFADKLYIGKQESSKLVTGLLNENWRMLMNSFGKPYMDKALDQILSFLNKFFETVPVNKFISSDLTKYARED
ncbi:hypothetical protein PYW07_003211 [Mythimna separata]|uniref:Uncharacterized protein n=1 Tax=Mythimna separata TaxID=271217 RepID=A0AAD7YI55_MYTSE|nr:hypothetical protein PYW07_003211 [Mythimna separata]UXX34494.1 Juvenile hormone-binding protein 4 [Mythimna separata]